MEESNYDLFVFYEIVNLILTIQATLSHFTLQSEIKTTQLRIEI
jgi:hypothetical protein